MVGKFVVLEKERGGRLNCLLLKATFEKLFARQTGKEKKNQHNEFEEMEGPEWYRGEWTPYSRNHLYVLKLVLMQSMK